MRSLIKVFLCLAALSSLTASGQVDNPVIRFSVSITNAENHLYHVELHGSGFNTDSVVFKMPQWSPGYYQLLYYSNAVSNVTASIGSKTSPIKKISDNTWKIGGVKSKSFIISYDVKADKKFVAQSYVDETRAYMIPASLFLYPENRLDLPVTVNVNVSKDWTIATGLDRTKKNSTEFQAPNFDILYDSPILCGPLESLPTFEVRGIEHRFIGYKLGTFDRLLFMSNLKKVIQAGSDIIGDIPYSHYTFIAIGPGRGGIEHLNNTTVSFDGSDLHKPEAMNRTLNFLAHEYFHHYNVKRIRPFELGPFNYDRGSKTNLLWVSEGISVYYEYLIIKRAGLSNDSTLFKNFEGNINRTENNPGRLFQSLIQASYETWSDGPFGTQGKEPGKAISYYEKGPVVSLLLDFAIRHATRNSKSLDDVMRLLYWKYYKELNRGFTDAEFQQTCETIAGIPLTEVFEYIYTTKELNYDKYFGYAGLQMSVQTDDKGVKKFSIQRMKEADALQQAILKSWLGE